MPQSLDKKNFWLLTCVAFSAMISQGIIDNSKGFTGVIMKEAFGADYNAFATYNAIGNIGYLVATLSGAYIQTRFGFKTIFVSGFIIGILGCILISTATTYPLVIIYTFILAGGMGFHDVAPTTLASVIFTEHTAAFFSIMNFFYGVGAIAGPSYSSLIYQLLPQFSFRGVYIAIGIVLALLSIYVIFCPFAVKYPPTDSENVESGGSKLTVTKCLTHPMVWFFSLIFMLFEMGERATSNWAGAYIKDVLKMDDTVVANFNTIYYIVFTFSRLVGGFISDRIGYFTTMYICLTTTILLFIAGFLIEVDWSIWIFCATGVFTAFYWPTFMCIVMQYFGDLSALPISVILPIQSMFQSLAQFPLGYINDTYGPEWAYRVTPGFCFISIILIIVVQVMMYRRRQKKDLETGLLEQQEQVPTEVQSIPEEIQSVPIQN